MSRQEKTKSLPYSYYFIPTLLLVLLGIADSLYLAISHYQNYTDPAYASFCAISKAINCDTVSQSPWSVLLGLPVAIWGFFGYLLFFILILKVRRNTSQTIPLWSILFFLGLVYSITAIFFGYISSAKIHAYCIMCIISYTISFGLLFYSWIILRRFSNISFLACLKNSVRIIKNSSSIKLAIIILLTSLTLIIFFLPHYWQYDLPPTTSSIHTGLTEEGNPWIGAKEPKVIIDEYSDYQCFQCSKMHGILRRLINEHPETIRLVHHNYPMDHEFNSIIVPEPFHVGSGKMALLAIYGAIKEKFWEMNDALYELGREKKTFNTKFLEKKTSIPAKELAQATKHPTIKLLLQNDIRRGMKLGITGTPTFVIDGETYQGSIPADILNAYLK